MGLLGLLGLLLLGLLLLGLYVREVAVEFILDRFKELSAFGGFFFECLVDVYNVLVKTV